MKEKSLYCTKEISKISTGFKMQSCPRQIIIKKLQSFIIESKDCTCSVDVSEKIGLNQNGYPQDYDCIGYIHNKTKIKVLYK